MADLKVDTIQLRSKAVMLRDVRLNLTTVNSSANEIASTVGHDRLAKHVRNFGSKWDLTRTKISERIEHLEEALKAIAETYEDLEKQLTSTVAEVDE